MDNFKSISAQIRKNILRMNTRAKASHTGSAFSIVDILTMLYFSILNIDPKNPYKKERDKFILSKGHASSALYATLAQRGFFKESVLRGFYASANGTLPGHLDKEAVPGVEVSSGSLGLGLSIGAGFALSDKIEHLSNKTYVLCGDGELNEGSIWEAVLFSANHYLSNLVLIVDYNKLQGFGKTNEILNLEPLSDKFKSFGWEVFEVNGHNFTELKNVFLQISSKKPTAIIAHTIKGKGVDFMENKLEWHYKSPNIFEFKNALKQLNYGA